MKMKEENRKIENIPFRCTSVMKNKIERKSEQLYGKKNISKFVSECIEMNLKKKTKSDKKHARALVELQEALNHIIIDTANEEIKENLITFSKGAMDLWVN